MRPLGVRPDGDVRLSKPVQQQKRKSLSFSFKRPSINLRSPPTKKAPSSPSPPSSPPPPSPTEGKKNGKGRKGVQQPIFCEVLDSRTQKLISSHPTLGKSCQFLVSNRLISKVKILPFSLIDCTVDSSVPVDCRFLLMMIHDVDLF